MVARDPAAFIRDNLRVTETPGLEGLRLYTAHAGSGLSRLTATPYWAYRWAGGMALARYLAERAGLVAGKRVLDFGAGSGLVAIAAVQAGAAAVFAVETDPYGVAAIGVNAALNGVAVDVLAADAVVPPVDLVLAGDVFYAPEVAERVLPVLERWAAAGVNVLVGDPCRTGLPLTRLERLASYPVNDAGGTAVEGVVFALRLSAP